MCGNGKGGKGIEKWLLAVFLFVGNVIILTWNFFMWFFVSSSLVIFHISFSTGIPWPKLSPTFHRFTFCRRTGGNFIRVNVTRLPILRFDLENP